MPRPDEAQEERVLRETAAKMRADHGPEHERHGMWDAVAALLECEAEVASYVGDPLREAAMTVCVEYVGASS